MYVGDSESFSWAPPNLNVTAYQCKCIIRNNDHSFTLNSTSTTNNAYNFIITSALSATIPAGVYTKYYQVYNNSDTLKTYEADQFEVLSSITDSTTKIAVLTDYERILKSLDDNIANVQTKGLQRIAIGDKIKEFRSLDELIRLRNHYAKLVRHEKRMTNKKSRSIRFTGGGLI